MGSTGNSFIQASVMLLIGSVSVQAQGVLQADQLQVLSCRTIKYPELSQSKDATQVAKGAFLIPSAPIEVYGAAWRGYDGARWPGDIKFSYGSSGVIRVETRDETTLFSVDSRGDLDLSGRSTDRRYSASRAVAISDSDRASLTSEARSIIGGLGGSQFICPPRDSSLRARVEGQILSELSRILSERQRACEQYVRQTGQIGGGNEFVRVAHVSGADGKSVLRRENFAWQKQSYRGPGVSGGMSCAYAPTIFNQFRCEVCSDSVLRDVLKPER